MDANIVQTVASEVKDAAGLVDSHQVEQLSNQIAEAHKVFVAGAGRSGHVARAFANRLGHLGLTVSSVGEPTAPPIGPGDLLVVVSGSGRTESLAISARRAVDNEANVGLITTNPEGPIAELSNSTVILPGTTRLGEPKKSEPGVSTISSIQPVGTLFEQLAWIVCDSVVVILRENLSLTNDQLIAHHANLE